MQEAKDGAADFEGLDLGKQPKEPVDLRYRTNDTTYEKLGELLLGNPPGILIERDELVSLLIHLDQEQQAVARGFYLSGWSGTQPYTFDRIGARHRASRRRMHFGARQHAASAHRRVRPASQCWRCRWRRPHSEVRALGVARRSHTSGATSTAILRAKQGRAAWETFERASKLDLTAALALGAHKGQFDDAPFLRFTEEARREDSWAGASRWRGRCDPARLSPALEGHLAKFRKLVPALALINHIADGGDGDVTQAATVRALAFAGLLGKPRAARLRLRPRSRDGGGQGHPQAHPQRRSAGRFHRTRYSSARLGTPDRARSRRPRSPPAGGP